MPVHQAIDMKEVVSSQIHSIGHDATSSTLAVRFKNGKSGLPASLYHYSNFTEADFAELQAAESIGKFFYAKVKPFTEKFRCEKQIEAEQSTTE